MSKAILVTNMPKRCYECRYCSGKKWEYPSCALTSYASGVQTIITDDIRYERSTWCPLRELPKKKPEKILTKLGKDTSTSVFELSELNIGFNACLDAIEGSGEHE